MSYRFQVRSNAADDQYAETEREARRLADRLSSGSRFGAAQVYDRHCTMIVYRSRNGRAE